MSDVGNYDFKAVEEEILQFWKKKGIYEAAQKKVKGKKAFYFLDGPPYTSGKVHVGTAWNKSLKDSILRYKRMAGFDAWDRAGYDMHGLPTEHATEKKLGIHGKEDIERIGAEKFIEECRKFSIDSMQAMNKTFTRLGVWMDFENPYMPISNEFIEGEWWLIKKAHENNRLYEGMRTITWCAEDGTALAKHELEYKSVTDQSVYLKFPIIGKQNEFLIVWTTTPWTIPYNLAVMVNPDITYVKAKVDNEYWIVAEALTAFIPAVAGKKFTVAEKFKGEVLEGIKYVHPFLKEISSFKEIKSPKLHSVLLSSEYVDTSGGSGLVHCAPGCGPEDYEVGHRNGLPAFNELDEHGKFKSSMGMFSGWRAKVDDKKFIEALDNVGALIETAKVVHDYAHCQRCHNPVVFRTTKQWFFKIEDLKENMRALNKDVNWVPDYAGSRQFDSWLSNLRDNSITRQRYFGTPAPIWRCDCGNYEVIGSLKELKEKTGKIPDDLHSTSLKDLTIDCKKCKKKMHRIPDVLDVWIDSATAAWNCLGYPQNDKLFKKLFPADFILEGIDQVRGWFNILLVASMVAMNKPSYKAVYMHGFINDSQGRKMSKSLGNYILPEEVFEKYGADTFRYYTIGGANPGLDLNYNFDDMQVAYRNLGILWNLHKFIIDYAETIGKNPTKIEPKLSLEEDYIISKLNSTIQKATEAFDAYRLNEIPTIVESLFLELSRTYIQLVREKSSTGSQKEKEAVLHTIYRVLLDSLKMLAPVAPFITDKMYLNLKTAFKLEEESIHLCDWPKAKKKEINAVLESSIEQAKSAMQAILSLREKMKRGVRWPVKDVILASSKEDIRLALVETKSLIESQTNIKNLVISDAFDKAKKSLKPDFAKLGPAFGKKAPMILAKLVMMPHYSDKLLKDGKMIIDLDGEKIELKKEQFNVETAMPDDWITADFANGSAYMHTVVPSDLDHEGYAREIMRKVQTMRKDSGLQKNDTIQLFIDTDMKKELEEFVDMIKERCGCKELKFSGKGAIEATETIKDKKFVLGITILKK
ncbi:MAG TPA: isoleucine--tRNA ligase [Candidatus Nanoarchaeia archaeon]|nr:isoleucine--tRNA ligase [Candidatus Nanoarchaeia archaeon]